MDLLYGHCYYSKTGDRLMIPARHKSNGRHPNHLPRILFYQYDAETGRSLNVCYYKVEDIIRNNLRTVPLEELVATFGAPAVQSFLAGKGMVCPPDEVKPIIAKAIIASKKV